MDYQGIVSAIDVELARLKEARALVSKGRDLERIVRKPGGSAKRTAGKRQLSPEARARIAEAQKRRWAAAKKKSR